MTLPQVRAIALPTRLKLLRCLGQRRATVTEISRRVGMAKSSALKHLRTLERHGLVRRHEDARLWVYYDLTTAGRNVARLDPLRVLILALIAFAGTLLATGGYVWWWGAKGRWRNDPWHMPPIGVDPLEPWMRTTISLLALASVLVVLLALVTWSRARLKDAPAEEPEDEPSSDTA